MDEPSDEPFEDTVVTDEETGTEIDDDLDVKEPKETFSFMFNYI